MPIRLFRSRDWLLIAPIAALAIVLGLWGFGICRARDCVTSSPLEALFRTVDLVRGAGRFSFDHDPWQLVIAQFLLPLSALVGGAKLVLQNLRRDLRVVLARRMSGHTIVCGLGDTGRQVVESLIDAGRNVVAIELKADSPNAAACERRGVAVLSGDAMQTDMLRIAGLARAQSLVLTCGSDASNIEIALRARDASNSRKASASLKIYPELRSEWLYDTLQTHRTAQLGSESAEFRLFNLGVNAARSLLQSDSFGRAAAGANQAQPHLLVAGFGRTAAEIVLQAVRCNFATPGRRLSVTILDEKGEASFVGIQTKCPRLREFAEIELIACSFAPDNQAAWLAADRAIAGRESFAAVVSLSADDATLQAALEFRKLLDREGRFSVPVYARLRQQHKLGSFLGDLEALPAHTDRLVPFGDLASLTSPQALLDQFIDALARATHEVYLANVHDSSAASAPWALLPERFKQSNRAFADHIPVKLAQIGLHLKRGGAAQATLGTDEIERLAQMEHWRWSLEQYLLGWRPGPKRDDFLKHHPLLVDWAELPEQAKAVNRELVSRIPAILGAAGLAALRGELEDV